MPKISVIVPVYKAEAYLHHCVDSLLAQTFKDFEILLVDDGSPDSSGEICDEYARQDRRVRVFHKENGGVSSARQCGLDNARGEYTIHADPDDWVESDMLEALYQKAKTEDADMVICDFYVERNRHQVYCRQQPTALDHEVVLCDLFQQLHGSCWNKLVKRACYNAYGVRFPEDFSFSEDLYVNVLLLKHDIKVVYLPKAYYHYVQEINENSLMKSYNRQIQSEDLLLYNKLRQTLQNDKKAFKKCSGRVAFIIVWRAFHAGIDTSFSFYKHYHKLACNVLRSNNANILIRCLLFLSCIGGYGIIHTVRVKSKQILK